MNKQEILNTVVPLIIAQGERSVDADGAYCRYRTTTGLKCFIGHMIPDEKYTPQMEGSNIHNLLVQNAIPSKTKLSRTDIEFLENCQQAHDQCKSGKTFVTEFLHNIKQVCKLYKLKMPKV